jgi:hypothetical protein
MHVPRDVTLSARCYCLQNIQDSKSCEIIFILAHFWSELLLVLYSNLSKLVAFDTNVYMGNNAKDPKVITQVLKRWSLISPAIIVLVPIVSA